MTSPYFGFEDGDGLGFDVGLFASLEPDVDHIERGLSRLPSQFTESELLKTLIRIYLEELQELEEAIYEIKRTMSIEEAFGFQLDIIGEQIGRRREARSDEDYRKLLKVQVKLNSSKGQASTVLDLWRYLLGTDVVSLKEEYPAGISLYAATAIPTLDILRIISKSTATTVKVGFTAGVTTGSPFCFLGNTGLGFSSTEAPTVGGKFVSRIEA